MPFKEFAAMEGRWAQLMRARPEHAQALVALGQKDIDHRWQRYEQLAKMGSE
jgi:pyruvate-ferredoxin/flavodoxin oxidoreductase